MLTIRETRVHTNIELAIAVYKLHYKARHRGQGD